MAVFLGLDPGGPQQFGWCVAEAQTTLPLVIRRTGLANYAGDAVAAALACLSAGEKVLAVGIDAPMYWVPSGDRTADEILRTDLTALDAPFPWGTVQHVNSLRGACLAQGMSAALLLRKENATVRISEAHPKVVLWLLGYASVNRTAPSLRTSDLEEITSKIITTSEHERDAAVAALSAWASSEQPKDWRNLLTCEREIVTPIDQPLSYWMPRRRTTQSYAPLDDQRKCCAPRAL